VMVEERQGREREYMQELRQKALLMEKSQEPARGEDSGGCSCSRGRCPLICERVLLYGAVVAYNDTDAVASSF